MVAGPPAGPHTQMGNRRPAIPGSAALGATLTWAVDYPACHAMCRGGSPPALAPHAVEQFTVRRGMPPQN